MVVLPVVLVVLLLLLLFPLMVVLPLLLLLLLHPLPVLLLPSMAVAVVATLVALAKRRRVDAPRQRGRPWPVPHSGHQPVFFGGQGFIHDNDKAGGGGGGG